jgi:hypothetical protein
VHRRYWYRLDHATPADWSWEPFAHPRYRFDSAAGSTRVRYAGSTMRSAMRERFDETGRFVPAHLLDLRVIELSGPARVIDVRLERNLDALGFDDQVNTSRAPDVWTACQLLSDRLVEWYAERLDGIVYRSRTTPQTSHNLAFVRPAGDRLVARDLGALREHTGLLAACVHSDGFAIDGW